MTGSIVVVGGSYGEDCAFPRSAIYRGSGLRAACILAGQGDSVTLHTALGPNLAGDYQAIAKLKGIQLKATPRPEDIWFLYQHPLAKPEIVPGGAVTPIDQALITADDCVVFGMLEGRPEVHAKRVVYDPQDGSRATAFNQNGSSTQELTIVASWSEGVAMTGLTEVGAMATQLLATPSCVCVVLKCGPQGALVATAQSQQWIRAFPSSSVWKIGSGDVFTAAYAHAWLVDGKSPLECAWFASRMVSEYVATREETFSTQAMATIHAEVASALVTTTKEPLEIPSAQIYLAGPFFTTAQQWMIDEVRGALTDMGFNVFSPIHDVGEGTPEEVAPADLHAIEHSALVLALLDGQDAGTLFEIGYARALDIPVVCIAESVDDRPLTMLIGSGCYITDDLCTGIYAACWQALENA